MMKNNMREMVQHDEKQHYAQSGHQTDRESWFNMMKNNIMPRVGIRQREMVQHDEKQHYAQSGHQTERDGST